MARRNYAGGAVPTTITAGINNTALTISIASSTGWPSGGANGKFYVTIGDDQATEERVLVQSRTGGTLTVQSVGDRGVDGTTAATWAAGTTIRHTGSAVDFDEANQHINDTAQDHHTQYMKADGTRHDLTARHAFGAALGTPGAPTSMVIGDAANAGAGAVPARSDHRHGAPSTGAPVSVGTALSSGSGTNLALANHVHDLANGSVDSADLIANGIITLIKMANEAATSYAPAFGGLALGDTVVYGKYWKLGRIVVGAVGFCLNTTGNVVGTITFDLPVLGSDLTGSGLFGNTGGLVVGRAFTGASGRFSGLGIMSTATATNIATAGASIWDGTNPVNWAPPDIFQGWFLYMAA